MVALATGDRRALRDKPLVQTAAVCGHAGGKGILKASAKRTASSVDATIFLSKRWSASLMLCGGPRSKSSRGGGRSKSMSDMRVARENMT